MKSYIINYNDSMKIIQKYPPKKITIFDTINLWDETEIINDRSGVFYHAYMNYYMTKYPNINWFRNRPNMKLQTINSHMNLLK
jgi:hypothetical protein